MSEEFLKAVIVSGNAYSEISFQNYAHCKQFARILSYVVDQTFMVKAASAALTKLHRFVTESISDHASVMGGLAKIQSSSA